MAENIYNNFFNNNTATQAQNGAVLHVRFDGQSRDIALEALRINIGASDQTIRMAVASFMDVAAARFDNMVIERHANGNMTLRPEAVFG